MELNELCMVAHQRAKNSGFYDGDPMLICSEVAEATEAVRHGEPPVWVEGGEPGHIVAVDPGSLLAMDPGLKPEGEAVELADAVIRIADRFAFMGWDLDAIVRAKLAYNATRPYRHGNKKI